MGKIVYIKTKLKLKFFEKHKQNKIIYISVKMLIILKNDLNLSKILVWFE